MKYNFNNLKNYNPDLYKALIIVWKITAIFCLILLFFLYFGDRNGILSYVPTCPLALENSSCYLCGSSRAFFEITKLNLTNAYKLNKLSPFLFGAILINAIIFIYIIIKQYKSKNNYENT